MFVDREQDMKKVVAVIFVLVVVLAIFIGIRSNNKVDLLDIIPTPTPEETPSPTPTPTPTPTPVPSVRPTETKEEEEVQGTPMVNESKPEEKPKEESTTVDKTNLETQIDKGNELLATSLGSSDSELADLVNELNRLLAEATKVSSNKTATESQVKAIYTKLTAIIDQVTDYCNKLYEEALTKVMTVENEVTQENMELAKEAIEKLPSGDQRTALEDRLTALTPEEIKTAGDLAGLKELLKNEDGTVGTIYLTDDIKDITETLTINGPIVINGQGHKLIFTGNEDEGIVIHVPGKTKEAVPGVIALGLEEDTETTNTHVVLNNLVVEGTESMVGVVVYDSNDVVLNNYTGSNMKSALQVNGSQVTLTGTTTVSGSKEAGIELLMTKREELQGSEELTNPTLTLAEGATIVQAFEEEQTVPTVTVPVVEKEQVGLVIEEGLTEDMESMFRQEVTEETVKYYLNDPSADNEVVPSDEEAAGPNTLTATPAEAKTPDDTLEGDTVDSKEEEQAGLPATNSPAKDTTSPTTFDLDEPLDEE